MVLLIAILFSLTSENSDKFDSCVVILYLLASLYDLSGYFSSLNNFMATLRLKFFMVVADGDF